MPFPLNAVAEIARAHESDLHRVDNYEVLQLRNQVLPLVRMGRRRYGNARTIERGKSSFWSLVLASANWD